MASRKLRLPAAAVLALVLLLATAAPATAGIFEPRAPHSPNAEDIRTSYWVALVVAAVLVIAVNLALLTALARFRDDRGRRPARFAAGRGVFTRAAVPFALIAAGLFAFGVVKTGDVRELPQVSQQPQAAAQPALTAQVGIGDVPALTEAQGQATATGEQPIATQGTPTAAPLTINAVGQQWLWRFEYPTAGQEGPPYDVFTYNELVVPVNTTVILGITSTDVFHRYFVPALGGQVDAVPGKVSQTWFRADREGTYPGQSTFFSGTSYSAMRIWVKVVSAQEYQDFLTSKRGEISDAQTFVQNKISQRATIGGVRLP